MTTPFRSQEFGERCAFCRTPTNATCRRCGTYVCEIHGAADDEHRCHRCEKEYSALVSIRRQQLAMNVPEVWTGAIGLLGCALALLFVTELGAARWLLVVGALGFAAVWGVVAGIRRLAWTRERQRLETELRRTFLEERT